MTTTEDKALLRKIDRRIIPFIWLLYLCNYIDRVNLGNVKTTLMPELGLTELQYTLCVGVFFIGYVIFEIPSNLMLKKARPPTWIARIVISWGIITTCTMFIKDFAGLMICRALLGIMEAGFFPGIIFYLTFWYRKEELAVRQSIFFTATSLAGAIAGLIAYGLFQINWGLEGWQWVFLVEGIPSVCFGIMTFFYLPDFPKTAKFLTEDERKRAAARLDDSVHSTEFNKQEFIATLTDYKIWLFCFLYVMVVNPLKAVTFFLPSLVESFGYTKIMSNLLTVPVYLVGAIATVGMAYSSDRRLERPLHVMAGCIVGAIGFALLSFLPGLDQYQLAYAASFLAVGGTFPATILSLTYLSTVISGSTRGATATAMVVSCGNVGGFVTPQVFGVIKKNTGSYAIALALMAVALGCSAILVLIIRRITQKSTGFQQLDNSDLHGLEEMDSVEN